MPLHGVCSVHSNLQLLHYEPCELCMYDLIIYIVPFKDVLKMLLTFLVMLQVGEESLTDNISLAANALSYSRHNVVV